MKYVIALTLFFTSFLANGQQTIRESLSSWGLGLRFGDPNGITAKKYVGNAALEISFGRSHWLANGNWYDSRFYDWYIAQPRVHDDFQYVGYNRSIPFGIQVHYLLHNNLTQITHESIGGKLEWYYGFGGQIRHQSYSFDYRYKVTGDPNWRYKTGSKVVDMDFGLDGVLGLEYKPDHAPVVLFTDMTLFVEIADDPFRRHLQGGIGGRYLF